MKWYQIPDFDSVRGDIKAIWEISRFSHFVTLARASAYREPKILRSLSQTVIMDSTHMTFHCTFNKISIHKGCLDLLGRPEFIQILVSPSTKEIALRGAASTEADTFRVIQSVYEPGGQFRIRCDEFLKRLCDLMGWSKNYAYRVEGTFSEGGIMLYDLTGASTLEEWDEGECE